MSGDATHGSTSGTENQMQDDSSSQQTQQTDTSGNAQPQYATVEQLNRALTSYNKRAEKAFQDMLGQQLNPLKEMLSGFNKPADDGTTADSTATSSASGTQTNQTSEANKDLLRLQRQLEDMNRKMQTAEQEKAQAVQNALDEKIKSQVLGTLNSLKVEKGEQVFRLIRDNIIVTEDGSVKMKVLDPTLGFEDEKDLKSGLTDWLNHDGAHFLPPRNLGGSGATNRSSGAGHAHVSLSDLNNMKPSDLAKVDLSKVIGKDALESFFNTNQ